MPTLYVRNSDIPALSRAMDMSAGQLWMAPPSPQDAAETFYRSLKTALLLSDWANELTDAKICERYSVGPGDIYSMVESINWLLHASAELARMFKTPFYTSIREYEICMKNGIRRELLPLIRLRGIGRVRSRRLFNNGIKTPDMILAAGIEEVTKILGRGTTEQIFEQLKGRKSDLGPDSGGEIGIKQSSLLHFG
jgi:helicase